MTATATQDRGAMKHGQLVCASGLKSADYLAMASRVAAMLQAPCSREGPPSNADQ